MLLGEDEVFGRHINIMQKFKKRLKSKVKTLQKAKQEGE
jgi:hypothetical protein